MKRFRTPVAKPGELLAKYGQEHGDRDLFYCYPDNECGMGRDSKMLMLAFERTPIIAGKTLRQELEARGYDITTLKFSVMKKTPNAIAQGREHSERPAGAEGYADRNYKERAAHGNKTVGDVDSWAR